MSYTTEYGSDEAIHQDNLKLVAKLLALPKDSIAIAWCQILEQKRKDPEGLSNFLEWMLVHLPVSKIKKKIKNILYQEMKEVNAFLYSFDGQSQTTSTQAAFTTATASVPSVKSPFTKSGFGWDETTQLGEALGLLQNGVYALSNLKKSALTGFIEGLQDWQLVMPLPLQELHEVFGKRYRVEIKTDRTLDTRTNFRVKTKQALKQHFASSDRILD